MIKETRGKRTAREKIRREEISVRERGLKDKILLEKAGEII